jgi:DNA-binding response OmpR family regulator
MAVILVIDDDAQIRQLLRQTLESAGHSVIEASDGREGLVMFERHSPAVVVTDILMPDKEGIEVVRALRSRPAPPRIVAISGGTRDVDYLDFARKFGADRVLLKPFRPKELRDIVKTLLEPDG